MQPCWIVAQTESRAEAVVESRLLSDGWRVYLPRCEELGRVVVLFPNYLFVGFHEIWRDVRWTTGVVHVLMAGEEPARVPDAIINEIKDREVDGLVALEPKFKPGQRVRVVSGRFVNRIGLWDRQTNRERERVLLAMLGQWVPVQLPVGNLIADCG
jgi:transcriptional antiterminator RfaH